MEDSISRFVACSRRIRGALLLFCALLLFVAGLLLLFAPVPAQNQSGPGAHHFHDDANGWIMGSQSHERVSVAGG
jgi:hypothetical protein